MQLTSTIRHKELKQPLIYKCEESYSSVFTNIKMATMHRQLSCTYYHFLVAHNMKNCIKCLLETQKFLTTINRNSLCLNQDKPYIA